MPVCVKCGRWAASVEMRRSPKTPGVFMCKDKLTCNKTKKEKP